MSAHDRMNPFLFTFDLPNQQSGFPVPLGATFISRHEDSYHAILANDSPLPKSVLDILSQLAMMELAAQGEKTGAGRS